MKSIHLLCLYILALTFMACNQKPDAQKAENTTPSEQTTTPTDEKTEAVSKTGEDPEGHDYTILTHKMLHYKTSVIMGKDQKDQPYKGQWIKLDSDGTFKAGKYKEQTHTGKWSYHHDEGILLLQPNDKNFKASEWKIQYNDDMVILAGTSTYGNNATQIQLIRSDNFPEEK